MGQFKDKMIDDMNVHEMQEYLNNHRKGKDTGYIKFLEEQLKIAEEKVDILIKKLGLCSTGKCVECFKPLPNEEIICGTCQDELDGRWDHLKEKEKGES
tara:strand:- start:360 stop:656 length:297 start_codon:yes stop_codon:yes gene_type:complete